MIGILTWRCVSPTPMKLRGKEHTDALLQSMYWAAARGAVYGGMISLGLLAFVKYRAPGFLNNKSGFVRSMLFVWKWARANSSAREDKRSRNQATALEDLAALEDLRFCAGRPAYRETVECI